MAEYFCLYDMSSADFEDTEFEDDFDDEFDETDD